MLRPLWLQTNNTDFFFAAANIPCHCPLKSVFPQLSAYQSFSIAFKRDRLNNTDHWHSNTSLYLRPTQGQTRLTKIGLFYLTHGKSLYKLAFKETIFFKKLFVFNRCIKRVLLQIEDKLSAAKILRLNKIGTWTF